MDGGPGLDLAPARTLKMSRWWLPWIELAAALLVLGFLAAYLAENWSRVAAHPWTIDWTRIGLASLGTALAYSGLVALWRHLLSTLGSRLTLADAHRIWYLSNLARYVPGKVAQLAGAIYLGRAKGVGPVASVASLIVSQLFALGAGLIVGTLALIDPERAPALRILAATAALVFLAVLLTPAFGALHRLALRILRREARYVSLPWRRRLALAAGYVAVWILLGASFHLFLTAVTEVPPGSFWPVVGIFALAYLAGYAAVFVPSGLGVREGALAGLLSLYIPVTIAIAVSFLARVWSTAVELAVAAILVGRYGVADLRADAEVHAGDNE